MPSDRKSQLEKNFFKIFFINALLNVKMINIVVSLFYVYRSLQVADIFYLGIIYSATVISSEIPSSYLADRFGRKRTIILAAFFGLLHWVFYLIAGSFLLFAIGTIFFSLAESFMSGTDEAVVYDTNKELGNHNESFKQLSRYLSSERVFKIASAFIGALIAKDLLGWQFNLIVVVDIVASFIAIVFAFTLIEPNHHMDVEKQEAGLIKDAYKILSADKNLMFGIINKQLIVIVVYICWSYSGVLFVDRLGIPVIILGAIWSIYHAAVVGISRISHLLLVSWSDESKINLLNLIFSLSLGAFLVSWLLFPQKYILLAVFIISLSSSAIRIPFFSNIFNKQFNSYNRATALSMSNFLRNVFDIPLLLIFSWLVNKNIVYPYVGAMIVGILTTFCFRINNKHSIFYEPKAV